MKNMLILSNVNFCSRKPTTLFKLVGLLRNIFKALMFHLSGLSWNIWFQFPFTEKTNHQTLLPSPGTSTTGHCFCFGSVSSFFLVLFLHSSLVAYWAPTNLGSSSFSVISLPCHTVHGVLNARILKCFAIAFSSGPHFIRTLHHDLSILGGPTWRGS